jgi:hypothetical protein
MKQKITASQYVGNDFCCFSKLEKKNAKDPDIIPYKLYYGITFLRNARI